VIKTNRRKKTKVDKILPINKAKTKSITSEEDTRGEIEKTLSKEKSKREELEEKRRAAVAEFKRKLSTENREAAIVVASDTKKN